MCVCASERVCAHDVSNERGDTAYGGASNSLVHTSLSCLCACLIHSHFILCDGVIHTHLLLVSLCLSFSVT